MPNRNPGTAPDADETAMTRGDSAHTGASAPAIVTVPSEATKSNDRCQKTRSRTAESYSFNRPRRRFRHIEAAATRRRGRDLRCPRPDALDLVPRVSLRTLLSRPAAGCRRGTRSSLVTLEAGPRIITDASTTTWPELAQWLLETRCAAYPQAQPGPRPASSITADFRPGIEAERRARRKSPGFDERDRRPSRCCDRACRRSSLDAERRGPVPPTDGSRGWQVLARSVRGSRPRRDRRAPARRGPDGARSTWSSCAEQMGCAAPPPSRPSRCPARDEPFVERERGGGIGPDVERPPARPAPVRFTSSSCSGRGELSACCSSRRTSRPCPCRRPAHPVQPVGAAHRSACSPRVTAGSACHFGSLSAVAPVLVYVAVVDVPLSAGSARTAARTRRTGSA